MFGIQIREHGGVTDNFARRSDERLIILLVTTMYVFWQPVSASYARFAKTAFFSTLEESGTVSGRISSSTKKFVHAIWYACLLAIDIGIVRFWWRYRGTDDGAYEVILANQVMAVALTKIWYYCFVYSKYTEIMFGISIFTLVWIAVVGLLMLTSYNHGYDEIVDVLCWGPVFMAGLTFIVWTFRSTFSAGAFSSDNGDANISFPNV